MSELVRKSLEQSLGKRESDIEEKIENIMNTGCAKCGSRNLTATICNDDGEYTLLYVKCNHCGHKHY